MFRMRPSLSFDNFRVRRDTGLLPRASQFHALPPISALTLTRPSRRDLRLTPHYSVSSVALVVLKDCGHDCMVS